jgi:hypothetical protein
MLNSSTRSLAALLQASSDVAIAMVAGGLAILVLYPLTLCAAGVRGLLRIVRLHPSPSGHFAAGKGK